MAFPQTSLVMKNKSTYQNRLPFLSSALLLGFAALIVLTSCGRRIVNGSGEVTTITPAISGNVSRVDIGSSVDAKIHVQPGATPSVTLSGYKNLLDELTATVEGNTLRIQSRHSINFSTDKDIEAEITVGSLDELAIHGAADASIDGEINSNDLNIQISGAGDVDVDKVNVQQLTARISGAGNVAIKSGTATNAVYKVSGAGDVSTFNVQAENVTATVSGTGDIKVFATKTLDASVSGAGSVEYKGTPNVKSRTSGIGSVVAAD
jgi:hypothetical protein